MSNEEVLEELCYLVARFCGRNHQVDAASWYLQGGYLCTEFHSFACSTTLVTEIFRCVCSPTSVGL